MNNKPVDRPKYLLDVPKWTIRLFDDCWDNSDGELKKSGYGAISYAWGKWRDRTANALQGLNPDGQPRYPRFDIGNTQGGGKLMWLFPIVRVSTLVENEQFTIEDVQRTLGRLGLRYVWWDWACIPQNLGLTADPGLQQDCAREMNKMRFVYPNSKRGIIWAHNVSWDNIDGGLRQALEQCCEYNTRGGSEQTIADVKRVIEALRQANEEELWLRSLWCFQEGVLLSHPNRESDVSSGVFRDRNGNSLSVDSIRGEGDLQDLVVASSSIAATIISILRSRAEDPLNPFKDEPVPPNPDKQNFQHWCYDGRNEDNARELMDKVIGTGMVFYTAQQPLSLLNARYNRERSQWSRKEDVEVNTIIGALEVNIEQYQAESALLPRDQEDQRREIEREGMLAELFKIYQWRMLLFATKRRRPSADMLPIWSKLVTIRDFSKQSPPEFTALEYFLSSVHLSTRFKPPKPRYEGVAAVPFAPPEVHFPLPLLEYQPRRGTLILRKLKDLKVYDLNTLYIGKRKQWKKAMFYDYSQQVGDGTFIPVFKTVTKYGDWENVFGKDTVLLPLEFLTTLASKPPPEHPDWQIDPWARDYRLRCVVLSNFGEAKKLLYPDSTETKLAGTFVGVVDVENWVDWTEDGPNRVPVLQDTNLEITEDVTVY